MFAGLDNNNTFYETFEKAVQRGLLYHLFFWVVFYLFLVIADGNADLGEKLIKHGIRLIFFIVVVNINIYYLFPRLLKKDRLYTYLFTLVLMCFIVTPLEVIMHYMIHTYKRAPFDAVFTLRNNAAYFLNIFFVAFSSSIYQIINDWMVHQRERKDLHRQNLKSELRFLKNQINPHFFFNTLNSLYALTLKKSDKAPEIVLKLSDMMRYMLYESNERTISLQQEIVFIRSYLELEQIRHGENFKMSIDIIGDPQGHKIAPLLFIPFLENSFKHGLDHELKSGYINIILKINETDIVLQVVNGVPGHSLKPNYSDKKVGGIGLTNVRRRLNILYPNRFNLKTEHQGAKYKVTLSLKGTRSKKLNKHNTKSVNYTS